MKVEKLDKKLKKMEQNKTAAIRYLQKKRAEQEALTGECKELEKKNEALKEKADALAKEIQYLKDLLEEVLKERGKKKVP
jgi:cyclic AMP-dependent transcription factor ATF-4